MFEMLLWIVLLNAGPTGLAKPTGLYLGVAGEPAPFLDPAKQWVK